MTQIVGTPFAPTNTSNKFTFTVPAGVTKNMVGVFVVATCMNVAIAPASLVATGASFTQLDGRVANNSYVVLLKGTGMTGGQTVTLNLAASQAIFMHHFYQDQYDLAFVPSGVGVRNGTMFTTKSGTITPAQGSTVILVATERTLNDNTAVTSVVTSGGETVTKIGYSETINNPDESVFFGSFVASAATPHTATITYSESSGNGYAVLLTTIPFVVTTPSTTTTTSTTSTTLPATTTTSTTSTTVATTSTTVPDTTTTVPVTIAVAGSGKPIQYFGADGTLVAGTAFFTDAVNSLATPTEVRTMPSGYPSVAAMLAGNPFYVAHRGGSLDWPEMSLQAYTQSAYWGVGAMEISLARSSDGVWFGMHDATLDRTSGTSGFTAAAHTWAEIQAFTITAAATNSPTQPRQPYMRWEELIDAYYASHVIFVDPKVALAFKSELLAKMNALPGTPTDRFVAKYYGVTSGWPEAARAAGYKTWGYFYQADVPNLAAYQSKYDILGMDYTANAASWSAVMSYGKPVIGHIAPTQAAVNTALNLGASGVMVSGVKESVPRSS